MQYTYIKPIQSFYCNPDNIVPHPRTDELYRCKPGNVFKVKPEYTINVDFVRILSIVDVLKLINKGFNLDDVPEMI